MVDFGLLTKSPWGGKISIYNVVLLPQRRMLLGTLKTLKKINLEEAKEICIRAYEALIKYDITELPIPITYQPDILAVPIQVFAMECHMSNRRAVRDCEYRGIVYYADEVNKYVILYNDEDPIELRRWEVALGIGYIEMWKELQLSRQMERTYIALKNSQLAVDEFAYYFTCPDLVLQECGIRTPEDIIEFCSIPFNNAREKSKRLKTQPLEFNNFERRVADIIKSTFVPFIESVKGTKDQNGTQ